MFEAKPGFEARSLTTVWQFLPRRFQQAAVHVPVYQPVGTMFGSVSDEGWPGTARFDPFLTSWHFHR